MTENITKKFRMSVNLTEKVTSLEKKNKDLEKTVEELQLNLRSKNDLIEELTMQVEKMKFDIKIEAERNAYISQATLNHLIEQWEKAE